MAWDHWPNEGYPCCYCGRHYPDHDQSACVLRSRPSISDAAVKTIQTALQNRQRRPALAPHQESRRE